MARVLAFSLKQVRPRPKRLSYPHPVGRVVPFHRPIPPAAPPRVRTEVQFGPIEHGRVPGGAA